MPSAGQLVASSLSKPQQTVDESSALHTTENNKPLKSRQPTAKELAAAKAARIRLGYEQADDEAGADELVSSKRLILVAFFGSRACRALQSCVQAPIFQTRAGYCSQAARWSRATTSRARRLRAS